MSLDRFRIGFFGSRNAGKSSLVNAFTAQDMSLVSAIKGTTTDPVKKTMELLPIGPCLVIDTAGWDDEGELGSLRIQKTKSIIRSIDIAVVVIDAKEGATEEDKTYLDFCKESDIPHLVVFNKDDLIDQKRRNELLKQLPNALFVSAENRTGIDSLKKEIIKLYQSDRQERGLLAGVVESGDTIVLVIPIDDSAPKGRLILPQQQVMREALDLGCTVVSTREVELQSTLDKLKDKPSIVITDSQVFGIVNKLVAKDIRLTSFSILQNRLKGDLEESIKTIEFLKQLKEGDCILISEGCTHHRQCGDIGRDKIPSLLQKKLNKKFKFEWTSGGEFKDNLDKYALVIHCGGCMLNANEMNYRFNSAKKSRTPITNYGILLSYLNGSLERSINI